MSRRDIKTCDVKPVRIYSSQASGYGGGSEEECGDVGYMEYQEREQQQGTGEDVDEFEHQRKKRRVTWQTLKERVVQGVTTMWAYLLYASYMPAIICMMVSADSV